jgi:hypothetical protein
VIKISEMSKTMSPVKNSKFLKVLVVLSLLYYVLFLLDSEESRTYTRAKFGTQGLYRLDSSSANDIRDRVRLISRRIFHESGENTIDLYEWESFLRIHELEVVTDIKMDFLSARSSTKWKVKSVIIIMASLMFFIYYILSIGETNEKIKSEEPSKELASVKTNQLTRPNKQRVLKILVALFFFSYLMGLLITDDWKTSLREEQETRHINKKDISETYFIDREIKKQFSNSFQEAGGNTIDTYHWESLLRTHELLLVTDLLGKLVSKKNTIKWKLWPVIFIFGPLLFFVCYISFRQTGTSKPINCFDCSL